MKVEKLDIPAAGTWSRDCELLSLSDAKGFKLIYHRDEDDTYWTLRCEEVVAYKVIGEEFSTTGYLINLPVAGAFFEIVDSPWIREFGKDHSIILDKCKHCVLQFYDEGRVIYVWGLCPLIKYEETSEFPYGYRSGSLVAVLDKPPVLGISYRLNEDHRWPLYVNRRKGWICLGDPKIKDRHLIEFAPNCVAAMCKEELIAVWLCPKK